MRADDHRDHDWMRAYGARLADAFTQAGAAARVLDITEAEADNRPLSVRLEVTSTDPAGVRVELHAQTNVYGYAGRYYFHACGWPTDDQGRQIFAGDVASYEERNARTKPYTTSATLSHERGDDMPKAARELMRRLINPIAPWLIRANALAGSRRSYAAQVDEATHLLMLMLPGSTKAHHTRGKLWTSNTKAHDFITRDLDVTVDSDTGTPSASGVMRFTLAELRAVLVAVSAVRAGEELRAAPADAWATIDETLELDRRSNAFDLDTREGIAAAVDRMRDLDADADLEEEMINTFDDGPQDTRDL